jgi:hypothetical protein
VPRGDAIARLCRHARTGARRWSAIGSGRVSPIEGSVILNAGAEIDGTCGVRFVQRRSGVEVRGAVRGE